MRACLPLAPRDPRCRSSGGGSPLCARRERLPSGSRRYAVSTKKVPRAIKLTTQHLGNVQLRVLLLEQLPCADDAGRRVNEGAVHIEQAVGLYGCSVSHFRSAVCDGKTNIASKVSVVEGILPVCEGQNSAAIVVGVRGQGAPRLAMRRTRRCLPGTARSRLHNSDLPTPGSVLDQPDTHWLSSEKSPTIASLARLGRTLGLHAAACSDRYLTSATRLLRAFST